jgi:hypothetical protein
MFLSEFRVLCGATDMDTDNDGIVSLADLLPIGQYLGSVNLFDGPAVTTRVQGYLLLRQG